MFGSNCLIDDLNTVVKANELCNRYGMDTISTGAAAAFAIEAYKTGLIGPQDTGGLEVEWGNGQALLSLIDKIASKQDIGELLAEGVGSAAARIGGLAAEFAIEVKGLEPPAHDPRARVAMGLGFATSNRGACHLSSFTMDFEEGATIDDLGAPALPDRFNTENKGENVFRMQNLMSMFDSLVCCKFVLFGGITVNPLIEFLNAITGWDMDHDELSATGDRIFNMKRLFNIRAGISRKDDVLPTRLLTHRRGGGTEALPVLNVMLSDYYRYRGWNEFGIPTRKRLEELELIPFVPKDSIVDQGLGEAWEK
jgi:aldehyde:ferredoxin oxidoreductase